VAAIREQARARVEQELRQRPELIQLEEGSPAAPSARAGATAPGPGYRAVG